MSIISIKIDKNYKTEFIVLSQISIFIYDYYFYLREVNKNKLLIRYSNKYKIIENYPNFLFGLTYFFLIFLGLFIISMISKNNFR